MVVGLGNPGRQYERTRHNLGFMVLMALGKLHAVEWKKNRQGEALTAEIVEGSNSIMLVLPLTYMNNSGHAVSAIAHFNKIVPEHILVVLDDIRLELADMRLRKDGSDGGHNGLRSITAVLGTTAYPRLRLGTGSPPPMTDQADYVLSEFSSRESQVLPGFITKAADCCALWIKGDMDRAMTVYNQRKEKKDNE